MSELHELLLFELLPAICCSCFLFSQIPTFLFFSSCPGDSFFNIFFMFAFFFASSLGGFFVFHIVPCYSLRKSFQAGLWIDGHWVPREVV